MTAEFEKRLELLRAFGQLHEDWRQPMEVAVTDLVNERTRQRHRAAEVIARMLIEMMTLTVAKTIPPRLTRKPIMARSRRSTSRSCGTWSVQVGTKYKGFINIIRYSVRMQMRLRSSVVWWRAICLPRKRGGSLGRRSGGSRCSAPLVAPRSVASLMHR